MRVPTLACSTLAAAALFAAQLAAQQQDRPEPTFADVSYGPHGQQRFDFYQADADQPAPLVVYIHGGGFRGGSKNGVNARVVRRLLDAGIHVASVEYRFVQHRPLPAAHYDSLRALQTIRSKAEEWKIDKTRVGAFGGSAGAQLCMWLAFRDEMADPDSADPVERESSRLTVVATTGGQTTMDMEWWFANVPGYAEPHRPLKDYYGSAAPNQIRMIVEGISALSLISADDPPIHMSYRMPPEEPIPSDPNQATGWKVHHVAFGQALLKKMNALGVEAHLAYPGAKPKYADLTEFFLAKLGE